MPVMLKWFLASLVLASASWVLLAFAIAELRWRDPRLKGWHRPLNILSNFRK